MTKYILIVELSQNNRSVTAYEEKQKDLLDEFEEMLKSSKISYEIYEISKYGFGTKISSERFEL